MKKKLVKELTIGEISFVDKPAQEGAQAVLIKSIDGAPDSGLAKGMFMDALNEYDTTAPVRSVINSLYDKLSIFRKAVEDVFTYTTIKNKQAALKKIIKEYNDAVQEVYEVIQSSISITKRGNVMKREEVKAAIASAFEPILKKVTGEDDGKGDENSKAEVTKAIDDASEKLVKALGDKLGESETDAKVAKMKPQYQEYLKAVEGDASTTDEAKQQKKEFFLSDDVSDEHRDMLVKAAGIDVNKYSEDQFTDGTGQIYKRAELGAAFDPTVALAKQKDDLMKKVADIETERADRELLAKSKQDLPNLPGDDKARVALVKAVEGIEDEATRTEVMKSLRAGNAALNTLMSDTGHSVPSSSESATEVETLAASIQKSHAEKGTPITKEKAYAMALESDVGDAAYDEARKGNAPQAAAH